jgi:hypothetical protein
MGMLDETRFIERLQFFNGQRLFASDLQGLEVFNREMRWLHNKSLHQPGIGSGFAVYGQKGDRQVSVGPGYAIDAQGREIVLTETRVEPVPPVSGEDDGKPAFYDLTVAYPDDADLQEAETRDGVCLPRGVVRLREVPGLCWVRLIGESPANLRPASRRLTKDIQDGLKIILARVEVLNCQLNQAVSTAQRRNARPDCAPYIACGREDPTVWTEPMDRGSLARTGVLVLAAEIDTSAAGFITTPCYSANIPGTRMTTVIASEGESEDHVFLIDFPLQIQDAQPDRFRVFLVVAMNPSNIADPILQQVIDWINGNWKVVWMGVEG